MWILIYAHSTELYTQTHLFCAADEWMFVMACFDSLLWAFISMAHRLIYDEERPEQ